MLLAIANLLDYRSEIEHAFRALAPPPPYDRSDDRDDVWPPTAKPWEIEEASRRHARQVLEPELDWWREHSDRELSAQLRHRYKPGPAPGVRGSNLTETQQLVVVTLGNGQAMSQAEIIRDTGLARSTVHSCVSSLMARGMVQLVDYRKVRGAARSPVFGLVDKGRIWDEAP